MAGARLAGTARRGAPAAAVPRRRVRARRSAARASEEYEPFEYGRLRVQPSARGPPGEQEDGRVVISIDEGDAWGTSEHPTTRLVLRYLVDNLSGGESVLDFGCGTGVLAVAAAALGADVATGVDIVYEAVVAANENAAANALPPERVIACSNSDLPYLSVVRPAKYDVTLSNMLFNEQRNLLAELAALTREGGRLCVSGLIEEDLATCVSEYGEFFDFELDERGVAVHTREEGAPWVALVGVRNAREVSECVEDLSEAAVS